MDTFEQFKIDISKFSYIELTDWIISCRQEVPTPDGKLSEEYLNKVSLFCEKWEEHFDQNQDVYTSTEYEKAILHIGRRAKLRFVVDYGQGKEDISSTILGNTLSFKWKESVTKIGKSVYDSDITEASESIKNCFADKKEFKTLLITIVKETLKERSDTKIRVFKDGRWLKTHSYEELIKRFEETENFVTEDERRTSYKSYLKTLEDFGIPKTIFIDYMTASMAEKAYDKKFFVNLALALSLPCEYAEKLLLYNGYSMKDSIRKFDIICEKGLRIGFGRDYIIALIEKHNADMKKKPDKYVEVQNITKTIKTKK